MGSHWNGWVDAVAGGWEVNTINTWNTGLPVNVVYSPASTADVTGSIPDFRGAAILRPNLVGDPTGSGGAASLENYFNKSSFATPSIYQPFGNLARNAFRTPNFNQWDFAADKNFALPFREGMAVQFRSEFFNVLNHSNFGYPNPNFSSTTAFGTIRTTYPARQIQFALKLLF